MIDRGGDDGRLVIDARDGRIIRFVPAGRIADDFDDGLATYGPPPAAAARGEPRPPRAKPKVASRTPVPVPKPAPRVEAARPLAAQPAPVPAQQSAAVVPAKPAEPQTTGQAAVAAAPVKAKPAPQILPTQEMPKVQGLE